MEDPVPDALYRSVRPAHMKRLAHVMRFNPVVVRPPPWTALLLCAFRPRIVEHAADRADAWMERNSDRIEVECIELAHYFSGGVRYANGSTKVWYHIIGGSAGGDADSQSRSVAEGSDPSA